MFSISKARTLLAILCVTFSIYFYLIPNKKLKQRKLLKPIQLDQIVLFGDSITQHSFNPNIHGWGAEIAHQYMRKMDVVNRGYSGYNTEWCKVLLPSVLSTVLPIPTSVQPPKIRLITIFLGANDACFPETHHQYVPLENYKKNLLEMISLIRINPEIRILLISPPPVDASRWSAHCILKGRALDRSIDNTRKYRDACLEVAEAAKVPIVDTWELYLGKSLTWTSEKTADILSDGLHLAKKGNSMLSAALMQKILTEWPELNPNELQSLVAWHDQIDVKNITESMFQFDRNHWTDNA